MSAASGTIKADASIIGPVAVQNLAVSPLAKSIVLDKSTIPPGRVIKMVQYFKYTVSIATQLQYTFRWEGTNIFTYQANTIVAPTVRAGKIEAYFYNVAADSSSTPMIQVAVSANFQGGLVDVTSLAPVSVSNANSGTTPLLQLIISNATAGNTDAQIYWLDSIWTMEEAITWGTSNALVNDQVAEYTGSSAVISGTGAVKSKLENDGSLTDPR